MFCRIPEQGRQQLPPSIQRRRQGERSLGCLRTPSPDYLLNAIENDWFVRTWWSWWEGTRREFSRTGHHQKIWLNHGVQFLRRGSLSQKWREGELSQSASIVWMCGREWGRARAVMLSCTSFLMPFFPHFLQVAGQAGCSRAEEGPREVQLPGSWEQNQGKSAGEKREHPGLWPQSKDFVLWKKCNGVSSTPSPPQPQSCPLPLQCPVEV